MIEAVGHSVIKLTRIRMGPLVLGDLASRQYRFLTDREANRLRELVEDRVARVERPELDASGKPARWKPPTEPAPPRRQKPERSGRGPKSQRSERSSRSQRSTPNAAAQRPSRGRGPRRTESGSPYQGSAPRPGSQPSKYGRKPHDPGQGSTSRRTGSGSRYSRPTPRSTGSGSRPGPNLQGAAGSTTPRVGSGPPQRFQSGPGFQRSRSAGKPQGLGRGATVRRPGQGQKSQQGRRGGPSPSRQRGPAKKSRPSTRRRV
jgi:23S rRNA pseudouridine2605 synthase